MKNAMILPEQKTSRKSSLRVVMTIVIALAVVVQGCQPEMNDDDTEVKNSYYNVKQLVSDEAGADSIMIDVDLKNAWGMAISQTGEFWIGSNQRGALSTYDAVGNTLLPNTKIPFHNDLTGGIPTGLVYNNTDDFIIPQNGEISKVICVGEEGGIHAWSSGSETQVVVDRSSVNAVYKGVTMAKDQGENFVYATNFRANKIEVFDKNWDLVDITFDDPSIPAAYSPFNIQNIDGNLYVTYAKMSGPDSGIEATGTGSGYVNIFSPSGARIKRFASQGSLDAPWGIVQAPTGFGQVKNAILIGNSGDGRINVFSNKGVFMGQLESDSATPITIDGLWAISFPSSDMPGDYSNQLFFTAGPEEGEHGLFGYVELN